MILDGCHLIGRASDENFEFGILLEEIYSCHNAGDCTQVQTTHPYVNPSAIHGLSLIEVAVVQGIDEIRISGMRTSRWPINDNSLRPHQVVKGVPESLV
jgi:hypothetical protein